MKSLLFVLLTLLFFTTHTYGGGIEVIVPKTDLENYINVLAQSGKLSKGVRYPDYQETILESSFYTKKWIEIRQFSYIIRSCNLTLNGSDTTFNLQFLNTRLYFEARAHQWAYPLPQIDCNFKRAKTASEFNLFGKISVVTKNDTVFLRLIPKMISTEKINNLLECTDLNINVDLPALSFPVMDTLYFPLNLLGNPSTVDTTLKPSLSISDDNLIIQFGLKNQPPVLQVENQINNQLAPGYLNFKNSTGSTWSNGIRSGFLVVFLYLQKEKVY